MRLCSDTPSGLNRVEGEIRQWRVACDEVVVMVDARWGWVVSRDLDVFVVEAVSA